MQMTEKTEFSIDKENFFDKKEEKDLKK